VNLQRSFLCPLETGTPRPHHLELLGVIGGRPEARERHVMLSRELFE
jgi:hypothetical protein